jgi:hypothetical protein
MGQERRTLKDEGPTTVTLFDTQCSGQHDVSLFVPDDKQKAIVMVFYEAGTGKIKALVRDLNRDGQFDETLLDTNGDGRFDTAGKNNAGEIIASNLQRI